MTALLTDNLPLLAGAPNGIKKLRELILELAVRGKLVPQDPSDEPASGLLKRISEEKTLLVAEGKIKQPKSLASLEQGDQPTDLPAGWVLSRLGEIVNISTGKLDANAAVSGGEYPFFTCSQTPSSIDTYSFDTAAVLLAGNGDFNLKKFEGRFDAYQRTYVIEPVIWRLDFCFISISAEIERITENNRGSAIPYLKLGDITNPVIWMPPLAEQHRIVAKVDELMALCDSLEAQQADAASAHAQLVQALLGSLTQASDAAEFAANWQRLAEHFHTLFTTEPSIDALKQTLLQLAVMGKLVPQDPSDEPAGEDLVKELAHQRDELRRSGRIRESKEAIDFSGLDEMKIRIPPNWNWVRMSEIAEVVRGGSPRPAGDPQFYGGDIPFLKVADITAIKGKYLEGYSSTIKEAGLKKTRYIDAQTVLLTNSGATLGVPGICNFPASFNDGVAAFIEKSDLVFDEYLYLYLKTLTKWFLTIASRGQGQPNLNTDIIKSTWFALPPLAEQHRIVAKVDQLMALCDQLKTRLTQARQLNEQLASTLVEQAVA